jgi:isoquinoline 1-oxidoreductase beta subunit
MTEAIKTKKKMGKWSRRGFITAGVVAGGALVVGVAIRPGHRAPKLAKYVTVGDETLVSAWVKIDPSNKITAIIPHSEMGQGVLTSLGQMLAEEMNADWDSVDVMEAPGIEEYANFVLAREFMAGDAKIPKILMDTVDGTFLKLTQSMGLQITGGSTSVRFTGVGGMQLAGAAAKELLLKAASKQWDVPLSELRAENSYIHHDKSSQSAPYATFAAEAANHKPNLTPKLKTRKDYTIMGQPKQRFDIPAKVDGTASFGMDVDVPGMKIATVKASPVHGATVASMDASAARKMPGVVDVLNMDDFVAVVADSYWQAKQALEFVDVTFTSSESDSLNQDGVYAKYNADLDAVATGAKAKKLHKSGNVETALAGADSVFEAAYQVPYLAHACMEPMNATAWIKDGKCDVWTGTQNPLGMRQAAAKALDLKSDNVTVHNQFMGGGFGRRSDPDYIVQAVRLAQKTNLPIKMIWSREETMGQDHYRPSAIARLKAGLDADGMPVSWENQFVHKLDPPEASDIFYDIPNKDMSFVESPTHVRLGPWRSVDHTQHGFYTESFVDELADNAGMDGYEYRRKLLKNKPRHLAVLDTAAKRAGWGKTMPAGTAQGIAIVHSFDTIVAEVVEVDMRSGQPIVTNVTVAADAGMAVNPDGFKAQMESGVIYGLTAALYGEITIEDGAVQQSNFHDYQMVRMDNAPDIDVVIVESDAPLGGAGEPGTPPIAPAVTNAIFAATGTRVRTLPIMNTDFGSSS